MKTAPRKSGSMLLAKSEETDSTGDRERCIRQPVQSAARNAKFLSSPLKAGPSIAGIATPREGDTSLTDNRYYC
jgi:hypothetical protein